MKEAIHETGYIQLHNIKCILCITFGTQTAAHARASGESCMRMRVERSVGLSFEVRIKFLPFLPYLIFADTSVLQLCVHDTRVSPRVSSKNNEGARENNNFVVSIISLSTSTRDPQKMNVKLRTCPRM